VRPGGDADPSPPSFAVGHERVELYLYSSYGPYDLYRASVPVQGCTLPLYLYYMRWLRSKTIIFTLLHREQSVSSQASSSSPLIMDNIWQKVRCSLRNLLLGPPSSILPSLISSTPSVHVHVLVAFAAIFSKILQENKVQMLVVSPSLHNI
jgi:hypothetical protein